MLEIFLEFETQNFCIKNKISATKSLLFSENQSKTGCLLQLMAVDGEATMEGGEAEAEV